MSTLFTLSRQRVHAMVQMLLEPFSHWTTSLTVPDLVHASSFLWSLKPRTYPESSSKSFLPSMPFPLPDPSKRSLWVPVYLDVSVRRSTAPLLVAFCKRKRRKSIVEVTHYSAIYERWTTMNFERRWTLNDDERWTMNDGVRWWTTMNDDER